MQTKQHYYDDIYLDVLETKVIHSKQIDGLYHTVLEETILFPEGGGMLADKGSINGQPVVDVIKKDQIIYHLTNQPLDNDIVINLDMNHRITAIQGHDAQHLLSAILRQDYNLNTISHHIFDDYCDIVLDGQSYPDDMIEKLQNKANHLIMSDSVMEIFFVDKKDLDQYNIKDNPKYDNPVRITNIKALSDYNACGCLHFSSLRYIQAIVILDIEQTSRGLRLTYVAGNQLIAYLSNQNKLMKQVYLDTKSNKDNVLFNLNNILNKNQELSSDYNALKTDYYQFKIETLAKDNQMIILDDISNAKDLKSIALTITSSDQDLLALLQAPIEDNYSFVLAKSPSCQVDIESILAKIKENHLVKGGGKGLSLSGQSSSNIASIIKDYL